jgi:hypothetical protein
MAIGDLIFNLMGQSDPRQDLATALGRGPGGMAAAINSGNSPPGAGPSVSGQQQPPGVPGQNQPQQDQQQQAPPPQPQAYQSPPDLASTYLKLMQRQQANAQINTGMGLLAGAFSHNQADRSNMMSAMENLNQSQGGGAGGGGIGGQLGDLISLQQNQMKMAVQRQMLGNLPNIAKELNMPLDQVQAAYASGALDDILKSSYTSTTPLNKAQVQEAVARAAQSQAETAKTTALTAPSIAEIQARIAQAQAETAKTTAMTAPSIAETQARTAQAQAETAGTIPDDQMKELNYLNMTRKSQGLQPLDILSYKMFSQPLDPGMRAYYMTHPEMMPSGMTGIPSGVAAPGNAIGAGSGPAGSGPVGSGPVPGPTASGPVPFDVARKANFNNIPPVLPQPSVAQPVPGESFQSWQARQGQAAAANEAATKAATGDQQESISALKDGAIDDIGVRVQHLQSLVNSPLLPYAVGKYMGRLPSGLLPQNLEDFRTQLKQAQEAVYQTATTKLKGVTNRATQQEIGRVAEALGKLDATNQSPDAYKQAINENMNDLASAATRTTQNAGVGPPAWAQGFQPTQPAPVTAVRPGLPTSSASPRRRSYDAQGNLQ